MSYKNARNIKKPYKHCINQTFLTVDDGAVMDIQFDKFYHQPPDGFDSIMIEQSLL